MEERDILATRRTFYIRRKQRGSVVDKMAPMDDKTMGGLSHYGEDSPLEIGTEMGQVNRFVLATHIGTWLCINEQTGQLNHVLPDLERVNLVFIEQDGKIVVDFSVSIPKPELRFAGVATESLEVSSYGDSGNLTIRIDGLYASAEAGGRIHITQRSVIKTTFC